jgi:NAD(P)-dependent dehydrogenase (short-subunit alcohol dehydrogenase family)
MIGALRSGPRRAEIAAMLSMSRSGYAEEFADVIGGLPSDKASFVTGALINAGSRGFLVCRLE